MLHDILRLQIYFFICLNVLVHCAFAEEIHLFDRNLKPLPDYKIRVRNIKPGSTIVIGNDRFILSSLPIRFGTNIIAVLQDRTWMIRLNAFYPDMGDDTVTQMIEGEPALSVFETPRTEIDFSRSNKGTHLVQRNYGEIITLDEYLSERARGRINPQWDNWLVDFAEKTAAFRILGDFGMDQIGLTGENWRILDWTDEHQFAREINDQSAWPAFYFKKNEDLFSRLELRIRAQRRRYLLMEPCVDASNFVTHGSQATR